MREYLNTEELYCGDPDIHSLLELLYRCYTEHNPIDNAEIRAAFSSLDGMLGKLTLAENDQVFYTLCRICSETEHLAFMEGLRVGLRLESEISAV